MCNSGILLTWTAEGGHPLLKEEVVEYFSLLFLGGGHHLQDREGFLPQGLVCVKKHSGHMAYMG